MQGDLKDKFITIPYSEYEELIKIKDWYVECKYKNIELVREIFILEVKYKNLLKKYKEPKWYDFVWGYKKKK